MHHAQKSIGVSIIAQDALNLRDVLPVVSVTSLNLRKTTMIKEKQFRIFEIHYTHERILDKEQGFVCHICKMRAFNKKEALLMFKRHYGGFVLYVNDLGDHDG